MAAGTQQAAELGGSTRQKAEQAGGLMEGLLETVKEMDKYL